MSDKPTVVISYSHSDRNDKSYVVSHLRVLEKQGVLDPWDDSRIRGGDDWRREIETKLDKAKVAVLLISRNSLTSNFILDEEVETMLRRRAADGLRIYPILIRDCAWSGIEWLHAMNVRPADDKALFSIPRARRDSVMAAITEEIAAILATSSESNIETPRIESTAPEPEDTAPAASSVKTAVIEPHPPPVELSAAAALIGIPKPDWPSHLGIDPPDSLLLRPESRCVRFHDYAKDLQWEILDWALEPERTIKLRLQAGRGGVGKTRLMIEVCEALATPAYDWQTGFLRSRQDLDRELPKLLGDGRNCLIVIDYAETRVQEVVHLCRLALRSVNPPNSVLTNMSFTN